MKLQSLEKLARTGIATQSSPDGAYINQLRSELIAEGILQVKSLDEGVVDLARNLGRVASQTVKRGLKTGAKTFLTYLFSGTNAKKMENDMREQVDLLVDKVNSQVKKLGAEQKTSKVILGEVIKNLKGVLGPLGFKLFNVVTANDGHAVSIIENPRIISGMTEPLVKMSLTFDPSQAPHEDEDEFIEATFSKSLGKRLFELRSAFAKKQDSNRVHDENTSMHSSGGSSTAANTAEHDAEADSSSEDTGTAASAAKPTGGGAKPTGGGAKPTGGGAKPTSSGDGGEAEKPGGGGGEAEKPGGGGDSGEKPAAPKSPKTWAEYKAAKIEPLNKGKPDVKPNIDGESKTAVAEDFVNHMLSEWNLFVEHGFSIPIKRMPEIKAMAKAMGNFIKAEGKLTDLDRKIILAEMKKLTEAEEVRKRIVKIIRESK